MLENDVAMLYGRSSELSPKGSGGALLSNTFNHFTLSVQHFFLQLTKTLCIHQHQKS
jgi:hypothetical protein